MSILKISGSGGRLHAVEQAESLHHLADELTNDLKHWGAHIPDDMNKECTTRIARLRAQARDFEITVLEWDRKAK